MTASDSPLAAPREVKSADVRNHSKCIMLLLLLALKDRNLRFICTTAVYRAMLLI